MTKGEIRKARKAARAEGKAFSGELALATDGASGRPEYVRTRTAAQERRHAARMDRWARRYDSLNGAPESWEDR